MDNRGRLHLGAGPELELTLLSQEHVGEFLALIDRNRRYLREWLAWLDSTTTVEALSKFIHSTLEDFERKSAFAMWMWHGGTIVGIVHLREISWENKKAMIGYWVGEELRGRGFAKQATRAMCDYGFGELRLNRVEIRCAVDNSASQAIPRGLGFEREGVLRQNEWLYDHFVDHIVFSMLAKDWNGINCR